MALKPSPCSQVIYQPPSALTLSSTSVLHSAFVLETRIKEGQVLDSLECNRNIKYIYIIEACQKRTESIVVGFESLIPNKDKQNF